MKLLDCQTSSEILTKYVPPWDEKRVFLGEESPSSKFKTNILRLHYLNIIPHIVDPKLRRTKSVFS